MFIQKNIMHNVMEFYCKMCHQTTHHIKLGTKWTCSRCGRVNLIEK